MAKSISGVLTDDARLIVFDEVTGSIEYNDLTSSGTYQITGLSDNDKTVISRTAEGESYGYGGVGGIASQHLIDITDCAQHDGTFTDESYHKASAFCDDTTHGFPSSMVSVDGTDNTGAHGSVGSTGANLMSIESYDITKQIVLSFDWLPTSDSNWNTSGVDGDAFHYVSFVNASTWYIQQERYGYANIRGASLRVSLNSYRNYVYLRTSDTTYLNAQSYINNIDDSWRPVVIHLDWPNDKITVWVDGNLEYDHYNFASSITSSLGSLYKLGFHWHTYTKTGYHSYRDMLMDYVEEHQNVVSTSADDGGWSNQNQAGSTTYSELQFRYDRMDNFVRFQNVSIPKGATIKTAYLKFRDSSQNPSSSHSIEIYGVNEDNASAATSWSDLTGRDRTSVSVTWNPPGQYDNGTSRATKDISDIVQEIVNRSGWSSGNALMFYLASTGSGQRDYASYDHTSYTAPQLRVTYSS